MRRYQVAARLGDGSEMDPFRPQLPAGIDWVLLATAGRICLVQAVVPDGTVTNTRTIADLADGADDVLAAPLNRLDAEAVEARLALADGSGARTVAGIGDRRMLLRFVCQHVFTTLADISWPRLRRGWKAGRG